MDDRSIFPSFIIRLIIQNAVLLCPPSAANLDHLTSELIITPQNRPTSAVCLRERHLQLRTQNSEFALFWLDACEQWEFGVVALAIRRSKIEVDVIRLEVDNRMGFVDLLEIQGCGDGSCGLVEIVSVVSSVLSLSFCLVEWRTGQYRPSPPRPPFSPCQQRDACLLSYNLPSS